MLTTEEPMFVATTEETYEALKSLSQALNEIEHARFLLGPGEASRRLKDAGMTVAEIRKYVDTEYTKATEAK